MSEVTAIVSMILGACLGAPLGALIGALVVQLIMRVLFNFTPRYWMTWRAVTVSFILSVFLGFILGFLMAPPDGGQVSTAAKVFFMAGGFFLGSAVMAVMIVHPQTGPIGFGRACLVSLVYSLMAGTLILGFKGCASAIRTGVEAELKKDEAKRSGGAPANVAEQPLTQ